MEDADGVDEDDAGVGWWCDLTGVSGVQASKAEMLEA